MRRILFVLFFLSGFSGLVYQVVWTRIAFAHFGIILPVLSVIISVFMLGLSLGAWAAGRFIPVLRQRTGLSAAVFYSVTELVIGIGGLVVPFLFRKGEQILLATGQSNSGAYLALSAIAITLAVLPWTVFMGATFPLMMAYIRERETTSTESFSMLYLANVLGAMLGTLLTALALVELFGFARTLVIASASNWSVAAISAYLGWRQGVSRVGTKSVSDAASSVPQATTPLPLRSPRLIRWFLFSTGFCAMAMEVVWARAFTPILRTQVYSFASILFCYLGATAIGSWLYRRDLGRGKTRSLAELTVWLAIAALVPILVDDFRLLPKQWRGPMDPVSAMMVLASIGPLCGLLGYLTPGLIDSYARGEPGAAGKAYALNVLGCILGPLFACYLLLPHIQERHALILLALPFLVFGMIQVKALPPVRRWALGSAAAAALLCSLFVTEDFQARVLRLGKNTQIRRDYAAFVVSVGEARDKLLMVNGMDMTVLSPVTKYMVHLPLALHNGPAKSVLIICFGMGTTYRSALSWDVQATTVELIPSVVRAFPFYHADAEQAARDPNGHIVIDDGRRFLNRTTEQFDAIVIDPPPPVMAAGSSLLYTHEFYTAAKQHLKPGGILQTWVPRKDIQMAPPVLRSLCESFPNVRCFSALEAGGYHLLASDQPIQVPPVSELISRIPSGAQKDLLEWSSSHDLAADVNEVLSHEVPASSILDPKLSVRITDDRPYNEYFLLRTLLRLH
jgi:spermidine synthase